MPVPPLQLVLDNLQLSILPAAGGAALVMGLFLLFGRWAGALGSAAAVAAGFVWANYTFPSTFPVDFDHPPDPAKWGVGRLLPWKPGEDAPARAWLPRAALVLLIVGLVSRWAGLLGGRMLQARYWWGANVLVWAPRAAAVAVVSGWLVPDKAAAAWWWLRPALAAAMLLSWAALDGVARSGVGTGSEVAGYMAAAFLAAGMLLIYHHWASVAEVAFVLGFAMVGVAVAAGPSRADASGAVPAAVAFLPGLMLAGQLSQDSKIPLAAFWLVALAPLPLLLFLIPSVSRQRGWLALLCRVILALAPLAVAVALAAKFETPAFGGDY